MERGTNRGRGCYEHGTEHVKAMAALDGIELVIHVSLLVYECSCTLVCSSFQWFSGVGLHDYRRYWRRSLHSRPE